MLSLKTSPCVIWFYGRILRGCREPGPRNAQVTAADARLGATLGGALPLTPAVVARSLFMTLVRKPLAARGQPGRPGWRCRAFPAIRVLVCVGGRGGGRKSIAELLTLFDRIN